MRHKQPAHDDAAPAGHKHAHSEAVGTAIVRDQIAGINRGGIHRQPDQPPRQRATGKKPIGTRLHTTAQINPVDNNRAVQQQHKRPVKECHAGQFPLGSVLR